MPSCTQCQSPFEVTAKDHEILDKMTPEFDGKPFPIPDPTLCFECRLQRRLAYYNGRCLYKRNCDFTKEPMISIYSPDKPHTVYRKEVWYGDEWDPLDYGRDFDFSRPFFEQFAELHQGVPQMSLSQMGYNQNSEYTNDNYKLKNCYLVFDGEQAEDAYYGMDFVHIKDCLDFYCLLQSQLCYECVHCSDSYGLRYSRYCKNCWECWFLRDCIGCKYCFGCVNMRQKKYCIFNEQKTKEEYEEFMDQFQSSKHSVIVNMKAKAEAFFATYPVKTVRGDQNIDCAGDSIDNCKSAKHCFDCKEMQDCHYCTDCLMGAKDCSDIHIWGHNMELSYNCCVGGDNVRNVIAGHYVLEGCHNINYSVYCTRSCNNLFACISLRHKDHCIFNKQYSPEEYHKLCAKIVEQMQSAGEWGQYFPIEISGFGYNETMAQTFFPLNKEEATEKGWHWSDYESPVVADKLIEASKLPDDSTDVPDDILNWAITCEVTGKPFKIVQKELEFYRTHTLPIPRRHPDQRHVDRFAYKNPYRLWDRTCAKCQKSIQTSYSPERPEIVYCEECYLGTVY